MSPPGKIPERLMSQIEVPLLDHIREAAREAARTVIEEHVKSCPIVRIEQRVQVLESRFSLLLGAIIGSGALGGATAAGLMKLLGN